MPDPDRLDERDEVRVSLPHLAHSRAAASRLIDDEGKRISGARVVLLGRDLLAWSETFTDAVVDVVLRAGGAARLAVVAAPDGFERDLRRAAERAGVAHLIDGGDPATSQ